MDTRQQATDLNGPILSSDSQQGVDLEMNPTQATRGTESQTNPKTADEGNKDYYLVKWDRNDPANPKSWNPYYKAWLTLQMALLAFVGSFGASIPSPAQEVLQKEFHVSIETTVLVVSLFVLGYAFGPMIWAPVGEVYGRRLSMLPAVFILGLFSIGTAVSQGATAVFLTRFFGGLFASAPISNVSAAIGDIYDPRTRGVPMALMAFCVVGGPCIAPLVGAAIVVNPHLGWRWTEYIQAIITFAVVGLTSFALPETYHPVLLKQKARCLRKDTGDERYWHPHEAEKINVNNILIKYISRPARMLIMEPMVTCIAVYASFVYGLLFFQLESFPVVFGLIRKYSTVVSTLPFLGLFTGVLFALVINFANQPLYAKALSRNQGRAVPEARLPPMLAGGVLFSTGIFWFGWTADPGYSWVLPTIAAVFELPRGHLRTLGRERDGWEHLFEVVTGVRVAFGGTATLSQPGRRAGFEYIGRNLLRSDPNPFGIHEIWEAFAKQVEIYTVGCRLARETRAGTGPTWEQGRDTAIRVWHFTEEDL
ncbi:hypothetical protein PV08_10862 [Exophiala spinifera]|uniref:Major facilitator superfamily (MFS) profile domain-containing protein n=1 Tax=Exophiala spinifera TaxID=91928 RepID=A0A0D1Y9B6_9EURO|nr:uncharacterized protein PV08_10862 [Exophiala spinifera]KIW11561.1 hypothetical protein PV08_10862 [Exophiala spinifera]